METVGTTQPVTFIPATSDLDPRKLAKPSTQESLDFKLSSEQPRSKVERACLVSGCLLVISLGAIAMGVYYAVFWGGDAGLFPGLNVTSVGPSGGGGDGGGGGGLGGDGGGGDGDGSDGGGSDDGGGDGGGDDDSGDDGGRDDDGGGDGGGSDGGGGGVRGFLGPTRVWVGVRKSIQPRWRNLVVPRLSPPVASVPAGTAGVVEPPKLIDAPVPEHPHPEPSFEKPPNRKNKATLVYKALNSSSGSETPRCSLRLAAGRGTSLPRHLVVEAAVTVGMEHARRRGGGREPRAYGARGPLKQWEEPLHSKSWLRDGMATTASAPEGL
ncbi:hypothetical protein Bbelb_141240 [Branchiostoma belcheri]|nr:hypothetical protein Bbelb_141240 [Branchiostoma belcheri]